MSIGFFKAHEIQGSPGRSKCVRCGLSSSCLTPRMPVYGEGKRKVFILAEAPGETEDRIGRPLIGVTGQRLRSALEGMKIDMDRDCWASNSILCKIPYGKQASGEFVSNCRSHVWRIIQEAQPSVILTMGKYATESILRPEWNQELGPIGKWVGWQIPSRRFNAWVCPVWHPSYISRSQDWKGKEKQELVTTWNRHLRSAFSLSSTPQPTSAPFVDQIPEVHQIEIVSDREAVRKMRGWIKQGGTAAIDYETTGLKPEAHGHRIVCCSICFEGEETIVFQMGSEAVKAVLVQFLQERGIAKVAANLKFEERWSRVILGTRVRNWIGDTMLAAHFLDNRPMVTGLKFQAFVQLGVPDYASHLDAFLKHSDDRGFNRIDDAPIEELMLYCGLDSLFTYRLYEIQTRQLRKDKYPTSGLGLLIEGTQALATIEENGIRIDHRTGESSKRELTQRISALEENLQSGEAWKQWELAYGRKANLDSRTQFADVLFNKMGHTPAVHTATGAPATGEDALEQAEIPVAKTYVKRRRFMKARDTYVDPILRESPDGILRPFFNLHIPKTYRSSSDHPNFQNIPVRNPYIKRVVRRMFRARPGRRLVDADYKGIEVAIAACYHQDPNMIAYLENPKKDLHRDMAAECYRIPVTKVTKDVRYWGKSGFVFPQFYGSYYVQCAPNLWKAIRDNGLETTEGISIRDVLQEDGIQRLGSEHDDGPDTFLGHIKGVENRFWNERFPTYARWKRKWWRKYQLRGYFDTLSGFRCSSLMTQKEACNYPIQGSAFHCLLWSLIRIQKEIERAKMKTLLVGQIHDDLLADVPEEEMDDYCNLIQEIVLNQLRDTWKWINVPLEVEIEASEVNGTWFEKTEWAVLRSA